MSEIPVAYDRNNGAQTLTEAMQELRAFRNSRAPQDTSFLKRTYPVSVSYDYHEPEQEPAPAPKKGKRK